MGNQKEEVENTPLRQLQLAELSLFKQFIEYTAKHNIPWFAEGGTVLGAVRHGGFIPWDEDIDLGIPRREYEKFLRIVKKDPPPFIVRSYRWDKDFNYGYVRLECPDVRVTRPYLGETVQQYAWIDLSPMDGMPKNKVMYKIWVKYLLLRRAIHSFAKFGDRTIDDIKSRIKNPVVRFAYQMFYKLKLYRLFDERKETRKLDRACARFSDGKEAYYANVMGGSKDKDIFPVEVYAEGVELPFEDIKIRCPKNYEVYLTQTYGADYMSPPPEDKRDRHHILDIEFLK